MYTLTKTSKYVCVHNDNNYIIMCVSIDSRCVLGYLNKQVKPLSYDHKPLNKEEKKRIEGAGGYVQWNRVGEYRHMNLYS